MEQYEGSTFKVTIEGEQAQIYKAHPATEEGPKWKHFGGPYKLPLTKQQLDDPTITRALFDYMKTTARPDLRQRLTRKPTQ